MNINRAKILQLNGPNGTMYYGGDQGWYSSNTWAMGGCGSIAASNALRYLCATDKEFHSAVAGSPKIASQIKDALCSKRTSKENYSLLMTGIYRTMWAMEIFPLNRIYDNRTRQDRLFSIIRPNQGVTNTFFIIGTIRFAHKCGLNIRVHSIPTAFYPKQTGIDFINDGLSKSGAVVLLTSYNKHSIKLYPGSADFDDNLDDKYTSYTDSMKSHFATITDIDEATNRLLITTWGRPGIVDIEELTKSWRSIKAFESTLFYLEPCSKKESYLCMLSAWKPFIYGIIQSIIRKPLPR